MPDKPKPDKPTGRPPRGARRVGTPSDELPPAAARLYGGYEAADPDGKGLDFAWPSDHPYGDLPRYEGGDGDDLFSAEEREMPLDKLRERVASEGEPGGASGGQDGGEGGGGGDG